MHRLLLKSIEKAFLVSIFMFAAGIAYSTDVGYTGTFQGTEGAAKGNGVTTAKTYTRDMNTTGDRVTFQVVYSSYVVASSTFSSASYTLNTPTITINANNFTTGLQVLYSVPSSSPSISGLTTGTTYYVSVIKPNNNGVSSAFKLASTSTGAVAGLGIVLASSQAVTDVYTLAPLAFTNTNGGGLQLQGSNDNATFFNLTTGNYGASISSVTFSASGSTFYDLGVIQYRYLRLNEIPPTTGAINYTATDNERYSFKH